MKFKSNGKLKNYLGWIFNISMIVLLASVLDGQWKAYGILGYIILVFVFPVWRLFKNRDSMFLGLKRLETSIWGKPLDKKLWKKGEMKNTKVIATFRGKDMSLKNILTGWIPKPKKFENKHMAATCFAFFFMFFAIFMANWYSINLIFSIIFLMLSLHFKQAQLIRETQEMVKNGRTE